SLGLQLLEALLEADYFSPTQSFEFGARRRDYGYRPNTQKDRVHWFVTAIRLARRFASKNDENASIICSMVARSISSLWFVGVELQDQFEATADDVGANGYWQEGWIAVRFILSHLNDDEVEHDSASVERLRNFETRLRPKNTAERIRAIVLSKNRSALDYVE